MPKLVGKGGDTNKHEEVRLRINEMDLRRLKKIKAHYEFSSYQETIAALIKRAIISIDTGK